MVKTKVISASASVTESVEVAAKIASVGISTPPMSSARPRVAVG